MATEVVLDLVGYPRQLAGDENEPLVFRFPDDMPGPEVMLPQDVWEELGCPSVITVRVVPGDALNEED